MTSTFLNLIKAAGQQSFMLAQLYFMTKFGYLRIPMMPWGCFADKGSEPSWILQSLFPCLENG